MKYIQKVGVLCKYDGQFMIVEYSEVSEQVRCMRADDEPDGRLLYDAGNICNHYFKINFLRDVCLEHAVCACDSIRLTDTFANSVNKNLVSLFAILKFLLTMFVCII